MKDDTMAELICKVCGSTFEYKSYDLIALYAERCLPNCEQK